MCRYSHVPVYLYYINWEDWDSKFKTADIVISIKYVKGGFYVTDSNMYLDDIILYTYLCKILQ